MPDAPNFSCHNEPQRQALRHWTIVFVEAEIDRRLTAQTECAEDWLIEVSALMHASFERAKAEMPYLTWGDFLRLREPPQPTRRGPKNKPLYERIGNKAWAAIYVRLIQELWAKHGQSNRTETPTALEIAADLCDVEEQALSNYLNRSGDRRADLQLLPRTTRISPR